MAMGGWATWVAYKQAQEIAFNDEYLTVRNLVQNNTTAVEGTVARISEALNGLAEASRAQPDMGSATFDSLADQLIRRYPAVHSLGLAQRAKAGSVELAITEKNWLGDFVPAAGRSSYVAIGRWRQASAAEPATATAPASISTSGPPRVAEPANNDARPWLGFDLLSSEPIEQAINQAAKSGRALSYTALQNGLALFVTRVDDSSTDGERYIIGEISIAQLLSATAAQTDADVQVLDISAPSGNYLLYSSLTQKANAALNRWTKLTESRVLEQTGDVQVLDKTWGVNLRPLPSLLSKHAGAGSNIAILGAAATLLFALLLYSLLSRNARVQREVETKTNELDGAYRQIREKEMVSMQTEKMSALGQMIAGVAHEINTPLGFVTSNVQTMQEDFDRYLTRLETDAGVLGELRQWSGMDIEQRRAWYFKALSHVELLEKGIERGQRPKNMELTSETIEGLERISELVSSLKDFSRVDRAPVDQVDIHHCIARTLNIARNQTKQKAEVITQFGDLPQVRCNPSQINQVLLNLISNAAQALPAFGKIVITTAVDGADVCVQVKDNGAGMTDAVKNKVFEPFFTTKAVGQGTGLGLAICNRIIKDHGGRLWVESQLGVGTVFSFTLPIAGVEKQLEQEEAFV